MNVVLRRFAELAEMAERIQSSKRIEDVERASDIQVLGERTSTYFEKVDALDAELLVQWRTSALSLITSVFGANKPTSEEFRKAIEKPYDSIHTYFLCLRAIFLSAKADYEGGYVFDVVNLANAVVFEDELEQAKHLLDRSFKVPAAVIAGTVLETTLRRLCEQTAGLSPSENINKMNDELAKATCYNAGRKKQITAWADIRNNAAHGRPEEFEPADVNRMIEGVRDFVAAKMH